MVLLVGSCTFGGQPSPSVSVSPSTDLGDGQSVLVSVAGFPAGARIQISECVGASAAIAKGCGPPSVAQGLIVADGNGGGHGTFVVSGEAPAGPFGTSPIEACSAQCVIVAGASPKYAVVSIVFSLP